MYRMKIFASSSNLTMCKNDPHIFLHTDRKFSSRDNVCAAENKLRHGHTLREPTINEEVRDNTD